MKWFKFIVAWLRIPSGPYCSGCPYWRPNIAPIEIGDRTIAYCRYMDKTDLDLYEERKERFWTNQKTKQTCSGTQLPNSFSTLLWDGCKECGIKERNK